MTFSDLVELNGGVKRFANRVGRHSNTIYNWMAGRSVPSITDANEISKKFSVPLDRIALMFVGKNQ